MWSRRQEAIRLLRRSGCTCPNPRIVSCPYCGWHATHDDDCAWLAYLRRQAELAKHAHLN